MRDPGNEVGLDTEATGNSEMDDYLVIFFQITRRYAEFSAAIVSLNESFPDEKVQPYFVT